MRKTTFINYWAPAIVVIVVVLAGVLLFASAKGHILSMRGPHSTVFRAIPRNSESGLPSSLTMLTASENLRSDLSSLSEDAKGHHTNDDISALLAMFVLVSLLISLLSGRFMLALYERAKASSVCCLALERPG